MRFIVVFDACVLYPAPLRDFLLRLATTGLFAARWTDRIHAEWIGAVLRDRPELEAPLARPRELMNQTVPDCLVENDASIAQGLAGSLPDENDVHVLAAAVRCGAQLIVTFNLKDFPNHVLGRYDLEAVHPDHFLERQIDLHQGAVIEAAKKHRSSLQRPPVGPSDYLETLAAQGLVVTADRLREFEALL